jgi:hypothetical protein
MNPITENGSTPKNQTPDVVPARRDRHYWTNSKLIVAANNFNDEIAYEILQERAAHAGCLIRDLPRSMEDYPDSDFR